MSDNLKERLRDCRGSLRLLLDEALANIEMLEAQVAALRASAVAEPVGYGYSAEIQSAAGDLLHVCRKRISLYDTPLYAHPAPAAPVPSVDRCAKCGEPRKEHAYNGACYGVCSEFVAAAPVPAPVRETLVQRIQDNVYRANGCTLNCDVSDAIRSALVALPVPEAAPTREEIAAALQPFAEFARLNIGSDGTSPIWASNIHRESISTWFGPSDFAAILALKSAPAK